MAEELEQFEDPGLKTALRRTWGGECCPFAIRRRVLEQLGRSERPRRLLPLRPLFGLAAAALVLLAVGLVWHPWQRSGSTPPTDVPALAVLPASLATDLTERHDECSRFAVHADPTLTQSDPVVLGEQMRERLNFPVLSQRLPRGWSFRGAAYCPVGAQTSAHMIYFRDGDPSMTISVFSLPPSVWPGEHSPNCAEMTGEHAVAGIATKQGFYCFVGSAKPPVPLSEIRGLLDDVWPQFAQDDGPDVPGRVTIAGR